MINISEIYIITAINIRKKYLEHIDLVMDKELLLNESKEKLDDFHDEFSKLFYENDRNSFLEKQMKDKASAIYSVIAKLNDEIEPILISVEKLKKDSSNLYKSIKEKYPDITDEEIENQIKPRL